MIKMKDLLKESRGHVQYVDPQETNIDYYNDLNRMEKESGIYVVSYKNLSIIAVKDGRCVGAMYEGITNGDTFSFDIIVDRTHRRQGIATKLIDIALSHYQDLPEGYKLELKVANAHLIPHLEKRGLKIVGKETGNIIMTF